MKPFYFGDSSRPLFGIHHPAQGRQQRAGVVICHPFGQEYLRAHRSLRELGSRLAGAGFHALRFDYHTCGDSAGEAAEARVEEWLGDTLAATLEIRETAGSPRVALVGLRLGATLAGLAADRLGGVEALVLWDPILKGATYLEELRAAHATWIQEHARGAPALVGEVLGFPLPEALVSDLASLDMGGLAHPPARRVLVVSSDDSKGPPPIWPAAPAETVERRQFPPAPVWLHAEGMERALVPGELLASVVAWLEGACA